MRFFVLGPLEVAEEDGGPLAIAGSKERAILACLIAHAGRVVSVDDLIEELWGEHPPRTAVKTLASYVSRLRHALQSGGYRPSLTLASCHDIAAPTRSWPGADILHKIALFGTRFTADRALSM